MLISGFGLRCVLMRVFYQTSDLPDREAPLSHTRGWAEREILTQKFRPSLPLFLLKMKKSEILHRFLMRLFWIARISKRSN